MWNVPTVVAGTPALPTLTNGRSVGGAFREPTLGGGGFAAIVVCRSPRLKLWKATPNRGCRNRRRPNHNRNRRRTRTCEPGRAAAWGTWQGEPGGRQPGYFHPKKKAPPLAAFPPRTTPPITNAGNEPPTRQAGRQRATWGVIRGCSWVVVPATVPCCESPDT